MEHQALSPLWSGRRGLLSPSVVPQSTALRDSLVKVRLAAGSLQCVEKRSDGGIGSILGGLGGREVESRGRMLRARRDAQALERAGG